MYLGKHLGQAKPEGSLEHTCCRSVATMHFLFLGGFPLNLLAIDGTVDYKDRYFFNTHVLYLIAPV